MALRLKECQVKMKLLDKEEKKLNDAWNDGVICGNEYRCGLEMIRDERKQVLEALKELRNR